MSPSLDEIQQAINKCTHMVLAVTKGVTLWEPIVKGILKNFSCFTLLIVIWINIWITILQSIFRSFKPFFLKFR